LLLNKAYDSNESQLEIIDALLYVAKAETNQLHLEPKKINITVLINEVIDDLRLQASKKNIRAIFRNTKPVYAEIDPRYMKMALSNIVNNAIKYSHRDSSFRVSLKESSDEILISVKDKGVGIEPNKMQQLFNKFTRLPNKYSQLEGGSGLGLFLSKQIVMAHGGEIDVYSRPEQETVFIIHIPKNSGINNSDTANRIFDKRRVDLSNG